MRYSFESIVKFVITLIIALMFIYVPVFDPDIALWADLLIRLGGTAIVFMLGLVCGKEETL